MKTKSKLTLALLVVVATILACARNTENIPTDVTPLPEPTATFTPEFAGPCANALYPFTPGRQWTYQKLAGGAGAPTPDPLTSKFGIGVVDVTDTQAILHLVDLGTGATTETTVDCQDGAILNFPLMVVGTLFGSYLSGEIQSVYVSGVLAPKTEELEAAGWNMDWSGEYVAAGTVVATSEGEQTTITLEDSPITLRWQIAGQETITVPAGTYEDAYKVLRTTEVQATIDFQGMTGEGMLTFETTHWFAPYIGLLKSEITSATLTTFGFTFPLEISGSFVLFDVH